LEFTRKEANLVESNDLLSLSTVSQNGWPHCVPVSYVYLDRKFYVPASSKSKKIRNLRQNHRATILVDDDQTESGLMMECEPKILTGSPGSPKPASSGGTSVPVSSCKLLDIPATTYVLSNNIEGGGVSAGPGIDSCIVFF